MVRNSDLTNINIENGLIENNQIKKGIVTVDGTEYELTPEDPAVTIDELVSSEEFDSNIVGFSGEETQIKSKESNVTLDMKTNETYVGGSMKLQRSDTAPKDVEEEKTNTSQYVRIKPTNNIEESTDNVVIKLSYTQKWIEEKNIDEDTISIYRYDENDGWVELEEKGTPSFCNGVEKNTEQNYVKANVSKFSTYELNGQRIQTTDEDGGDTDTGDDSGGTGSNIPSDSTGTRKIFLSGTNPTRSVSQVQENHTIIVSTETKNQSLLKFNTTAKEYLGTISINVNHLGRKTNEIPEHPNTYSYTQINLENTETNEIKNSSLTYRVAKNWINDNEADSSDVVGKVYTDEGWVVLNTEQIGETDEFYKFKSETPKFGYFSFGLKPKIITTNTPDTEIKNQYYQNLINQNFNKIYLGKAGADLAEPTYTQDTMKYKGKTYTSDWKQKDYAIIQVENHQTEIVGTHRYGTRAASMYYKENKPTETILIHWEDQNDNNKVEWEEIETIE